MKPTFFDSLTTALEKLNKLQWRDPLANLASHFEKVPEQDLDFHDELLNLVWSLDNAATADPDVPLNVLMSIRLSKLDSWTLRAMKTIEEKTVHWNPLTQSFSEFKDETTKVMQMPTAYPAEDIIKRWSKEHLH